MLEKIEELNSDLEAGIAKTIASLRPKAVFVETAKDSDPVNHPSHYTSHPSGVECIQITEHMNFNLGNSMKYIWRAGEKNDDIEDLRKAQWFLVREIDRLIALRAKYVEKVRSK